MSWDFTKRLTFIIKHVKINSELTDFPICIRLEKDSCENNFDTGIVIDRLTVQGESYSNRKKIFITSIVDGVETSVPCELDIWEHSGRRAVIWAKIPKIYADRNTIINLYYDLNSADNDMFVDIGEQGGPKELVWDDNYKGVWHFSQTAPSDMLDSSKYINDGTCVGTVTSSNEGLIGKSLRFYNIAGSVDFGTSSDFDFTSNITMEVIVNITGTTGTILNKGTEQYKLANPSSLTASFRDSGDVWQTLDTGIDITNMGWVYIVWGFDGDLVGPTSYLIVNDIQYGKTLENVMVSEPASPVLLFDDNIEGYVTEMRFSNILRDPHWVETSSLNARDTLLEGADRFVSGYVTFLGDPAEKELRLYDRDTGELMNMVNSKQSNGYYYITTTSSGNHFLLGMDGGLFNHVVAGNLEPLPI